MFLQAIDVRLLLEELVLNVILVADATEDLTMLQAGPPRPGGGMHRTAACGLPTVRVSPPTGGDPSGSQAAAAGGLSQRLPASPPRLCLLFPWK